MNMNLITIRPLVMVVILWIVTDGVILIAIKIIIANL